MLTQSTFHASAFCAAFTFTVLCAPAAGQCLAEEVSALAHPGGASSYFGRSVAVSGEVAVVGNYQWGGGAYVYEFGGLTWTHVATLTDSDGDTGYLGFSVDIEGDLIVICGTGSLEAAVYVRPPGGWANTTETAKLTGSDAPWAFGGDVAVSGDAIVVSPGVWSSSTKAYVYEKPETGWTNMTETAILTASSSELHTVAIDGDVIVAGAFQSGTPGAVHLFEKPAGGWASATETAILTASDGAAGDYFGLGLAIDGEDVVVGAPGSDGPCSDPDCESGSVYVFSRPGVGWASTTETAKLTASDAAPDTWLGRGVAIHDTVIVGGGVPATAYGFVRPTGGWVNSTESLRLDVSNGAMDEASFSMDMDAGWIVAGMNRVEDAGDGTCYAFRAGDCNANGIIDLCDIANGSSVDANGNWMPDECECVSGGVSVGLTGARVLDLGDVGGGANTYRVVLDFDDACDQLLSITGNGASEPLGFTATSPLINAGAQAGTGAEDVPQPDAALWDSWITLGIAPEAIADLAYSPGFPPGAVPFVTGTSFSATSGGWYDSDPGTPVTGASIVIAQLTLDGDFTFSGMATWTTTDGVDDSAYFTASWPPPTSAQFFVHQDEFDAEMAGLGAAALGIETFEEAQLPAPPNNVLAMDDPLDDATDNGVFQPGDIIDEIILQSNVNGSGVDGPDPLGVSGLAVLGAGFAGATDTAVVANQFGNGLDVIMDSAGAPVMGIALQIVSFSGGGTVEVHVFDEAGTVVGQTTIEADEGGTYLGVAVADEIGGPAMSSIGRVNVWDPDLGAEGAYDVTVHGIVDCLGDLDGDDAVGFTDLLTVLSAWGSCSGACEADLDGSGDIGFGDLLVVLSAWGPCV